MGGNLEKEAETFSAILPPSALQPLQQLQIASQTVKQREQEEQVIEPSLSEFLTAVNMTGLEYRLRLAGVLTLIDLANHSVDQLARKGFTELMARRLMRALDDYILNFSEEKEIGEPEQPRTPFQVVRPNAVLPTKAPTLMRRMDNFGRRAVKRHPTSSGTPSTQRHPAIIRLQSEPPSSFSLTNLTEEKEETDSSRGGGGGGGEGREGGEGEGGGIGGGGGGISDQHVLESHLLSVPVLLERSQSVPSNLHMSGETSLDQQSLPSLIMETPVGVPSTSLTETVSALEEGDGGVEREMCVLYALLDVVKDDLKVQEEEVIVRERGVSALCRVLDQYSGYSEMVILGCRVMRCIVCVSTDLATPTIVNAAITVLDAMTQHLHCQEVQLNGCLTLSNLCSTSGVVCDEVVGRGAVPHLTTLLEQSSEDEVSLLTILPLLSKLLFTGGSAEQLLLTERQHCLTLTAAAMARHKNNRDLLLHGLSLFALGLAGVSAKLESTVIASVIAASCAVLQEHTSDQECVLWGCKVFAQLGPHDVLQQLPVAEEVVKRLVTALRPHPSSSPILMWGSFALYQVTSNNKDLLPLLKDSGVLVECRDHLSLLSEEAQHYLQQLLQCAAL